MTFDPYLPEALEEVQFGVESAAGTGVTGSKRFHSLKFDIDPKKPTQKVTQAGNLFPVSFVPGKGHSEIGVKTEEVSVQDLIYFLSTLISIPAFTASGISTTAHIATFAPHSLATNPKKSLTLQKGQAGSGNASTVAFVRGIDLELDFVPDKTVGMTGKMWGRQYVSGGTLTASPTTLAKSLLFPTDIDVAIALAVADFGTSLVDPLSVKFRLQKTQGDVYTLRSDLDSFSGMVEVAPTLEFDLVFAKGPIVNAFVNSIDTATIYYINITAKGATIDTAITDELSITCPIQFSDPAESAVQDLHCVTLKANAVHVDDFNSVGGALLIACTSLLSAL